MATKYHGIVKMNEPMSRHTSWRIGGIADQFYVPESVVDLGYFLKSLADTEQLTWIGLGSNLLVRENGIRGTVICTSGVLREINFLEQNQVRIEVGVACPKMSKKCAEHELTGVEFLSGIPGTIGGALTMNAGALGSEIWEYVVEVEMMTREGDVVTRPKSDFNIGYREVSGKNFIIGIDEWFVAGKFKLTQGQEIKSKASIRKILQHRTATQPTQLANAGSVFRNPEGLFAAKLIEDLGLKGFCIGGACISEKHANFFINTGSASSNDMECLIKHVSQLVYQEFDIKMQVEVRIIGEQY